MIAIDTEATYEKKKRDIGSLGVHNYVRHPETNHYLCSIYGEGIEYVGPPERAPWDELVGKDVCAHNAGYDRNVVAHYYDGNPAVPANSVRWNCTADLAAYLQCKRSLKDAGKILLGKQVSKAERDFMEGKTWDQLTEDERQRVTDYAMNDARICHELWEKHAHLWPEEEREASRHTHMMVNRGIGVDIPLIEEYRDRLIRVKGEAEREIPWAGELDPKGKEVPITSTRRIVQRCNELGIEPPKSTDAKSELFEQWENEHGSTVEFVRAIQRWRRANRLLRIVESMHVRQDGGRMVYGLKYFGAPHTGRWSGDTGLNLQNLPRAPFEGVDVRNVLIPRQGHKFLIADLAQIEARVLLWIAGDKDMLQMIRDGFSIYEAHARKTMGYSGQTPMKDHAAQEYALAKARVLALGYGAWTTTFIAMARQYTGMILSPTVAENTVKDYRAKNRKIVGVWNQCERAIKGSLGGTFELELPSGRTMRYFGVNSGGGSIRAFMERGGNERYLYGGLATENCISGRMEVLTERRGWVRLSDVSLRDKVWDGLKFVNHRGLIYRGSNEVVRVDGVWATPDHRFLTHSGWKTACNILTVGLPVIHAQAKRLLRPEIRDGNGKAVGRQHSGEANLGVCLRLRSDDNPGLERAKAHRYMRQEVPVLPKNVVQIEIRSRYVEAPRVCGVVFDAPAVRSENASGLQKLRRKGYQGLQTVAGLVSEFLGGHGWYMAEGAGFGSNQQRGELRTGELPMDRPNHELQEQERFACSRMGHRPRKRDRYATEHRNLPGQPGDATGIDLRDTHRHVEDVFDILDCGPRHRFVVRGGEGQPNLIAHNCCQATARDIFARAIVAVEKAGIPVVLHVHDEIVCEVPEDQVEEAKATVRDIMTTPPDWAASLPLGTDIKITDRYEK